MTSLQSFDWSLLYSKVITATGWKVNDVVETSFCDVLDLVNHWATTPPAHISLAAIAHALGQQFGGGKATPTPSLSDVMSAPDSQQSDVRELLQMFPTGVVS